MNGVHDLGGMHGFGPVQRHDPALRFEYAWEPVAVAMQNAVDGPVINIDEFRHAIERMDPVHYLGSSYFEHWVESILDGCLAKGVFTEEGFEARERAFRDGVPPSTGLPSAPFQRRSRESHPFRREPAAHPLFKPGDSVRTKNIQPHGHTRLARYARDKAGQVDDYRGCFVFPDTNAHQLGECPQHLYSVRFEAAELWGESAEQGTAVHIDLFESYLLPVER